jgi:polyhydroxyalkanoate synthesis regulator phasin
MAKRKGTRADALRTAVDQTFHAAAGQAQLTRDRAQELVDELSHTATRVRDLLDDLRPPSGDEIRSVREELRALERRVAKLEGRGKQPEKPKRPAQEADKAKRPAKEADKAKRPAEGG